MINAESFDIPDQVRLWTGMQPLNRGSITSHALLREAIEKERWVELAFENHRWYDLVRTKVAVDVMNAHGASEKILKPTIIRPGAFNVTSNKLLRAIFYD